VDTVTPSITASGLVKTYPAPGRTRAMASRLAIVDQGRVVAEGDPAELKRGLAVSSLDEVYLHYAGRHYSDATRLTEVAGR
jgi:hypothetical protein